MTQLSLVRDFGAQLSQAKDPHRHRYSTAAIPIAALAIVGVFGVLSSGGATEPALAVSHHGQSLVIELRKPTATASQLTRDLHAAGVHGSITAVPTRAGSVGRWIAVTRASDAVDGRLPLAPDAKASACPDLQAGEPIQEATISGTKVTVPADGGATPQAPVDLFVGRAVNSSNEPFYDTSGPRNGDGDVKLRCVSPDATN